MDAHAILISIPEACVRVGVGRSFMYQLMSDGSVRSVKASKRRLVDVASLEQWAASLPESQLKQTAVKGK